MKNSTMTRKLIHNIVLIGKEKGLRAREIAAELKEAGYKVFIASFCFCEGIVFFDTHGGLEIRIVG